MQWQSLCRGDSMFSPVRNRLLLVNYFGNKFSCAGAIKMNCRPQ
ncbi:hypothetical protein GXM_08134 [Nostoc sphaeroides CCNUC1]|uniref:Uncharacterized protein n=1 Tax=Nostoc sphaeroides CCNUC1 TaxID=2653204 RepID=A0A5P8WDE7_9NOSO|nr:hypothetical protein GXM_08134 [Nostoc sphaeroides CCNUC1]